MRVLVALFFATLISCAAHAQAMLTGNGLACDTAEQVQRVIELDQGNYFVTVGKVNAEFGPEACVITRLRFTIGSTVGEKRKNGFVFHIVEITVYGAMTSHGMASTNKPMHWFTLRRLPGRET